MWPQQLFLCSCNYTTGMAPAQFYQFSWRVDKENYRTQVGRLCCDLSVLLFFHYIVVTSLGYKFKRNVRTSLSTGWLGYETCLSEICCCITGTELRWKCQQHVVIINKMSGLNQICNWKRQNSCFQPWNIHSAITAANADKSHL